MPFGGLWLEHNRMDDDGGPPGNYRGKDPIFNDLFRACFRIAREAGRPIIVENVNGAQRFVGRAAWHFGSYYLWGDVPALMPFTSLGHKTVGHLNKRDGHGHTRHLTNQGEHEGVKQRGSGAEWFDKNLDERRKQAGVKVRMDRWDGKTKGKGFNTSAAQAYRAEHGTKMGGDYFSGEQADSSPRQHSSRSDSRKAASAQIAKIPFPLAQHIARVFKP